MECSLCHKEIPKQSHFCQYCGNPTRPLNRSKLLVSLGLEFLESKQVEKSRVLFKEAVAIFVKEELQTQITDDEDERFIWLRELIETIALAGVVDYSLLGNYRDFYYWKARRNHDPKSYSGYNILHSILTNLAKANAAQIGVRLLQFGLEQMTSNLLTNAPLSNDQLRQQREYLLRNFCKNLILNKNLDDVLSLLQELEKIGHVEIGHWAMFFQELLSQKKYDDIKVAWMKIEHTPVGTDLMKQIAGYKVGKYITSGFQLSEVA